MADPILDSPDVRVEVFSNTAGCSVRLTHLPTGITVSSEFGRQSQILAKKRLAAELREKIAAVAAASRPSIKVDPEARASYVTLAPGGIPDGGVASTVEVSDRYHVDLSADRTVLGVEVIGEGNWTDALVALAMQGRVRVAAAGAADAEPYVKGWLDCAATVAVLCDMKADGLLAGRRTLRDRLFNPILAGVYRHAAEIARAVTVADGKRG